MAATMGETKKDYNLAQSNCGQTCSIGDKAAGIPHDGYTNVSPRDDHDYMKSDQGQKDGWVRVMGQEDKPVSPTERVIRNGPYN